MHGYQTKNGMSGKKKCLFCTLGEEKVTELGFDFQKIPRGFVFAQ
jgi:hypothetical protein